MILKKFKDNYDAEFVNLMLEIQNLIENFSKSDKLKINSWAKILCVPTKNIEFKKNRNLYAIKLLDNVYNGKLDEPFIKFVKGNELKLLNPILVKTQLSSNFLKHIKKYEENENIYNNPNMNNFNFIGSNNEYNIRNNKKNSLLKVIQREKIKNEKLKSKNNFDINYENKMLLSPFRIKRSKTNYKSRENEKINNIQYKLSPSDILLMDNYNNFPYRNKSNIIGLKSYHYNNFEKYKLRNVIEMLKIQKEENNELIKSHKSEIDQLKKKISLISVKIKKIFNS
jgi:hypothetical protein